MDDKAEEVILVDDLDREIGRADKLLAHRLGYRHRAISVCVVDDRGRMLLQRRADGKYHSGGLWTNACCTHPRPGESPAAAAHRRLKEELGVDCALDFYRLTHYAANVGCDLTENEIVHLFTGAYSGPVNADAEEVQDVAWRSEPELLREMAARPDAYTVWFRHYLEAFGDAMFGRTGPEVVG